MLRNDRPTVREEALRESLQRRLDDLEVHVEARREGLRLDNYDDAAENILCTGIQLDRDGLLAEQEVRLRRPLIAKAWLAGTVGMTAGVLAGAAVPVFVAAVGLVAVHLYLLRPRPQRIAGPRDYVDPSVTPSYAYRIAGENEKFTRAAMVALFGADLVDEMFDKAQGGEVEAAVSPIVFRQGEHPGLLNQEIHEIAARTFAMRVQNLDASWPALQFHVLYGHAGRGKTTLVKVLAQEIRDRLKALGLPEGHFIEAWGGDLSKPKRLDARIRLASSVPGSVLFIDEIHAIPPEIAERLYMLTDRDFRYQFEGDPLPTKLQPFTLVGATTDLGKLHPAFRSRAERVPLETVSSDKLMAIALGMPYDVEPEAARLIVSRVHWDGMPRAVVSLLEFAHEFTKSRGGTCVTAADVGEAITARRLDEWGLGPFHRDVVRALARSPVVVGRGTKREHVVYKLSETSLLAMAKVDPVTYREELRPALMDRGFIVTTSGGQQLTDAGLDYARDKGLAR